MADVETDVSEAGLIMVYSCLELGAMLERVTGEDEANHYLHDHDPENKPESMFPEERKNNSGAGETEAGGEGVECEAMGVVFIDMEREHECGVNQL